MSSLTLESYSKEAFLQPKIEMVTVKESFGKKKSRLTKHVNKSERVDLKGCFMKVDNRSIENPPISIIFNNVTTYPKNYSLEIAKKVGKELAEALKVNVIVEFAEATFKEIKEINSNWYSIEFKTLEFDRNGKQTKISLKKTQKTSIKYFKHNNEKSPIEFPLSMSIYRAHNLVHKPSDQISKIVDILINNDMSYKKNRKETVKLITKALHPIKPVRELGKIDPKPLKAVQENSSQL